MLVCLHELNTLCASLICYKFKPLVQHECGEEFDFEELGDLLHGRLYMNSSEYMVSGQKK